MRVPADLHAAEFDLTAWHNRLRYAARKSNSAGSAASFVIKTRGMETDECRA